MDKIKTLFKQYPLALLLALSWLILSGWGLVNFCLQPSEYSEIHTTGAMLTGDTTLIGSFFEGPGGTSSTSSVSSVLNRKSLPVPASYPKSDPEGAQDSPLFHRSAAYSPEREASDLSGILPDQELYPESDPGSEPLPEEAAEPEPEYTPFASVPRTPSEPRHPLYDDVGATALDTPADYITVEDDYFDHALFLGDSRIEGMSMASGLNNADYLYLRGVGIGYMSVLDLFYVSGGRFVQEDAQLTSVLQKNDYNVFYICSGINGMGEEGPEDFARHYKEIIDLLLSYHPDALVFILSIMNVTKEYSDSNDLVNNDNINSRNYRLAQLADGKQIFYLDQNPVVCSEDGGLDPELSTDGYHIRAQHYALVSDFLRQRGIPLPE